MGEHAEIQDIIFISFFTPDYAEDAQRLMTSLRRLGLKYDVKCIEPQCESTDEVEQWLAAVRYKPEFMKMLLEDHPECTAIVWVDADAVVNSFPETLFHIDADIGVHFKNGLECLSGTVYVANTEKGRELLRVWVDTMEKMPGVWEQRVLGMLLKDMDIQVHELGTSLCKIFDLVERQDVNKEVVPIIEHFQASRRWRRKKRKSPSPKQAVVRRSRTKEKRSPTDRNAVRRNRRRRRR